MTNQAKSARGGERPLTEVARRIAAPPDRVFQAITDPWLLPVWVVGATHIRTTDPDWPAPGSKIHHQVGAWPIAISDETAVLECEPPERLVLQGRAYPFGEAHIQLLVRPDGDGSIVCLGEAPSYGPARVMDNPIQRWLLAARNRESLARLQAIVENRREVSVPRPA